MVAPRSNRDCVKSAGRAIAATSCPIREAAAAINDLAPGKGASIANTLDTTRSTFPSIGTMGTPKAILAIAAAV
jgi:hypothetical protein